MAAPETREQFKQYCLRALGEPLLKVNVSRDQIEDRIDDALRMFLDYHFEGVEEKWGVYMFTDADIEAGYIAMPDSVATIVRVSPLNGLNGGTSNAFFDVQYQLLQSDFLNRTGVFSVNGGLSHFQMTRHYLDMLQDILSPEVSFQWNQKTRRLYIQRDLAKAEGVILHYYTTLDYTNQDAIESKTLWSDRWLTKYATALIKKQWGENLSKFTGPLPGGIVVNGDRIISEAQADIDKLEADLIDKYSLFPDVMVG